MIIFNYVQDQPSNEWTIVHNLGSQVSIEVRIEQGDALAAILPHEIEHVDDNTTVVRFSSAVAGSARLAGSWKFVLGETKNVDKGSYNASSSNPLTVNP